MSIGYNPSIVSSGLVLCLDAGNPRSYIGNGTSWVDVSGNQNPAQLIGSPTYISGTSGSFNLNGSSMYAQLVETSGFFDVNTNSLFADTGYAWSVNAWFNFPISPTGTRTGNQSFGIAGKSGGIGGAETFTLFVGSATDSSLSPSIPYYCTVGIRGTKTVISPSSVNTGTWNNATVTWNGTSGRVYFNGEDRGAANIGTAGIQNGYYFSVGVTGNASGTLVNVPQLFEGNISSVSVYSRALTAAEVLQNFNALRGRYGI